MEFMVQISRSRISEVSRDYLSQTRFAPESNKIPVVGCRRLLLNYNPNNTYPYLLSGGESFQKPHDVACASLRHDSLRFEE